MLQCADGVAVQKVRLKTILYCLFINSRVVSHSIHAHKACKVDWGNCTLVSWWEMYATGNRLPTRSLFYKPIFSWYMLTFRWYKLTFRCYIST